MRKIIINSKKGTYLQNRKRLTGIENKVNVTKGRRGGGRRDELEVEIM